LFHCREDSSAAEVTSVMHRRQVSLQIGREIPCKFDFLLDLAVNKS
jgi:hypothetical protein